MPAGQCALIEQYSVSGEELSADSCNAEIWCFKNKYWPPSMAYTSAFLINPCLLCYCVEQRTSVFLVHLSQFSVLWVPLHYAIVTQSAAVLVWLTYFTCFGTFLAFSVPLQVWEEGLAGQLQFHAVFSDFHFLLLIWIRILSSCVVRGYSSLMTFGHFTPRM